MSAHTRGPGYEHRKIAVGFPRGIIVDRDFFEEMVPTMGQ